MKKIYLILIIMTCNIDIVKSQNFLENFIDSSDSSQVLERINDLKKRYAGKLKYPILENYSKEWPDTCLVGNCQNGEGELFAGYKNIVCEFKDGKPVGNGIIVFRNKGSEFSVFEGKFDGWNIKSGTLYLQTTGIYVSNKYKPINKPLIIDGKVSINKIRSAYQTDEFDIRDWGLDLNFIPVEDNSKNVGISYHRNSNYIEMFSTEVYLSSAIDDLSVILHTHFSQRGTGLYPDLEFNPIGKKRNEAITDTTLIEIRDTYLKDELIGKVIVFPEDNISGYGMKFIEAFFLPRSLLGYYDLFEVPWVNRESNEFKLGAVTFNENEAEFDLEPSFNTYIQSNEIEKYVGQDIYSGDAITKKEIVNETKYDIDIKFFANYKLDCFCDGNYLFSVKVRREKTPLIEGLMPFIDNIMNKKRPVEINGRKFENGTVAYSYLQKAIFQRACNYKTKELIDFAKTESNRIFDEAKLYLLNGEYEKSISVINNAIIIYGGDYNYYQLRADAEEKRGNTISANFNKYLVKKMKEK